MRVNGSALLCLPLAFGLAACSAPPDAGPVPACTELSLEGPPASSLVLIVNDTMRRDSAGVYGGAARTPELDAFAQESLVFEHATSEASWTRPSITTLFTSLYPSQHQIGRSLEMGAAAETIGERMLMESEMDVLSLTYQTLPEILQAGGLRTAGFVANVWLEPSFGLAQGFENYETVIRNRDRGVGGDQLSERALAWLDALPPDEPFFLYLHYMDAHSPYGKLEEAELSRARNRLQADERSISVAAQTLFLQIQLTDGRSVVDVGVRPTAAVFEMAYHRGIEDFDRALGSFLAGLRAHPAAERTAVIVTSDHGEAFYDRGYGEHGNGLYDDEIAIPFVASLPGVMPAKGRVDCPIGLIDVLPTLCAYLGFQCPPDVHGTSFLPDGTERAARYMVSEGLPDFIRHRAIRNMQFKLIFEPGGAPRPDGRTPGLAPHSLYDLVQDPGETESLVTSRHVTSDTHGILGVLVPALSKAVPPFDAPRARYAPVSEEIRDRIRALGYID